MDNVFTVTVRAKTIKDLVAKLREAHDAFLSPLPDDAQVQVFASVAQPEAPVAKPAEKPKAAVKKKTKAKTRRVSKIGAQTRNVEPIKEEGDDKASEPANAHILKQHQEVEEEIDIDSLLEEEQPMAGAKNPTQEDVQKAAMNLFQHYKQAGKDGVKALKDVLHSYNVDKIDKIQPEVYSNFIQKCKSLM